MENSEQKKHWENVYQTKQLTEVSWYQPTPQTSLNLIKEANLPKDAAIIDIGGGDSFLTDHLLELGYTNLTVLDISEKALTRAKTRLGERSHLVNWIVSDVTEFIPVKKYALWHDRATFHFLTSGEKIKLYVSLVNEFIEPKGYLVMGTFSDNGPKKCSGLEITQYNENSMNQLFDQGFDRIKCFAEHHPTPFSTTQNFLFCSFRKK